MLSIEPGRALKLLANKGAHGMTKWTHRPTPIGVLNIPIVIPKPAFFHSGLKPNQPMRAIVGD